jgi:hypothetical protein
LPAVPQQSPRQPKYRHHKGSVQAFVQYKGQRTYLAKHGTPESWKRYYRFVADLLESPAPPGTRSPQDKEEINVVELCAAYWGFARGYYVKNGEPGAPWPRSLDRSHSEPFRRG